MRLAGRTAAITGASRGLGRRLATAFVGEGARVALIARASDALDSVAADLGDAAVPIACDVADPDAVRAAFATVGRRFGGLDILVNNAALCIPGLTEGHSDAEIAGQIAVNFTGAVFACRSAIPLLRRAAEPHIVNISSESAKHPFPMLAVYAATKAALEHYTATLRRELREDHIRVTALRAGTMAGSEIGRYWTDPEMRDAFVASATAWGNLRDAGATPAPAEAMAEAIVALLTLPRDLNADLLELRPLAP